MTDTERIQFIESTGASVVPSVSDSLLPVGFSACVGRVTGWTHAETFRAAIDGCEREYRSVTGKETGK